MIKLLFAAFSGLLLALSFPNFISPNFCTWPSYLAWMALLPLLFSMEKGRGGQAFGLGWVCGFFYFTGSLYWISQIGELQFLALPGLVFVAAYLALFVALWAWAVAFVEGRAGFWAWVMAPFLWCVLEYLRGHLLSGFPWNTLASSQYCQPYLLQVVDFTGQGGLSALIVTGNIVLYYLALDLKYRSYGFGFALLGVWLLMLGAVAGYGYFRLSQPEGKENIKVAVVQGNIPQAAKWSRQWFDRTLDIYERLTLEVSKQSPTLVVWPETSVPTTFLTDLKVQQWAEALAKKCHVFLLLGSSDLLNPAETNPNNQQYVNSVFLISPEGNIVGRYDKMHLVPFGEMIPFKHKFAFVDKLSEGFGDFVPGREETLLSLGSHTFGTLICYETIFPDLSRSYTSQGASLLVNVTNDAWFLWSAAAYQHASFAVLRAVENRTPLIRAANTGVSLMVDSKGRILNRMPLFRQGFLVGTIPLRGNQSFYSIFGEWFTFLSALVSLGCFIRVFLR